MVKKKAQGPVIDKAALKVFLDKEFLRHLKPGDGVHMMSLLQLVEFQAMTSDSPIAPLSQEASPEADKAWRKAVTDAVLDVLKTHLDFTDVNPNPPKGFWRR